MVEVSQDGAKFPGSPFQIQVGDSELCSAAKVKVQGAIKDGMANTWNEIAINVAGAGNHRRLSWVIGGRDPQILDWGSLGL